LGKAPKRGVLVAIAGVGLWSLLVGGIPLLSGPPGGDDAYYHAMRAQQQARCWRGGVLFPRWYPDLNAGLGGPEPRAYPLWPLTVHAALALVSDDGVAAIALATLILPVGAGLAMLFVAFRRGASPAVAGVAGLLWAGSPYFVSALHERAALAECWGLALLPLVLHSWRPQRPREGRAVAFAAITLAAMLACQLPLALMSVVVIGAWQVVGKGSKGASTVAGLLALAISAWSWIPNVASVWRLSGERLTMGGYDWRGGLLPGHGAGDPALASELVWVMVGCLAAAALLVLRGGREARNLAVAGLLVTALVTPLAAPLYRWVPGFSLLQFPWRWLGPAACLLVMSLVSTSSRALRSGAAIALLLPLAACGAWRWRLRPGPPLRPSDPPAVSARAAVRFGVPPLLPSLPAYLPQGTDLAEAIRVGQRIRSQLGPPTEDGPRRWTFLVASLVPAVRAFPLMASAGWWATIDGRSVPWVRISGLVAVAVSPGAHRVTIEQRWLPEDIAGLVLSGIGLVGGLLLLTGMGWGRLGVLRLPRVGLGANHD